MQKWQMQKLQDYCTFEDPGKNVSDLSPENT